MDKLKKNSKIGTTAVLAESEFFVKKDPVPTSVPMMNVALSGSVDGGIMSGLTVLAGPSKHFKTSFGLIMASSYLKAKPKAVMLFYDSEFGSPQAYFKQFDIDTNIVCSSQFKNCNQFLNNIIFPLSQILRNHNFVIRPHPKQKKIKKKAVTGTALSY